jgi:urease accessory protein UreH
VRPEPTAAYLRVRAGVAGEPIPYDSESSYANAFQPTPWGAWLIGEAAHRVGGDDLHARFDVGVGCCALIRSMDPLVARHGSSSCTTTVSVGRDAMLAWCPEPSVATTDADHTNNVVVRLGANSRLLWTDEFELDYEEGQSPGTWRSRLRVAREGWPAVSCDVAIGPGSHLWRTPAVLGGAEAVVSVVVVDPEHPQEDWVRDRATSPDGSVRGVALPLAGPGAHLMAWGPELTECRAVLARMLEPVGVPAWAVQRLQPGMALPAGSLRGMFA